jgi:hypothetical protein
MCERRPEQPIWSARARSGRPPPRPQTMLTVLTQTPPFVSGNCACEPGVHRRWSAHYDSPTSRPKRLVFVPALVLVGAPIGALPTSCRRLLGEGSAKTVLSKLLLRRSPIVLPGRHGPDGIKDEHIVARPTPKLAGASAATMVSLPRRLIPACGDVELIGAIVCAERGANISLDLRTFLQWMSR